MAWICGKEGKKYEDMQPCACGNVGMDIASDPVLKAASDKAVADAAKVPQ